MCFDHSITFLHVLPYQFSLPYSHQIVSAFLEIPSGTICFIHYCMMALNWSIDDIPGTTPLKRSEDGLHKTNAMAFWKFCMFVCYVLFVCFCLIMLFVPHFFVKCWGLLFIRYSFVFMGFLYVGTLCDSVCVSCAF